MGNKKRQRRWRPQVQKPLQVTRQKRQQQEEPAVPVWKVVSKVLLPAVVSKAVDWAVKTAQDWFRDKAA